MFSIPQFVKEQANGLRYWRWGGRGLESGGSTKKTKNRANTAFRRAAQSLARSQSASGAFYRRIRAKHGAPVAITATANRLARIVYFMLLRQEPYRDLGADYYDKQHQDQSIRNLQRRAAQLGLRLVPIPSAERVS